MNKALLQSMLTTLVSMIISRLSPEAIKKWADAGLDMLEDYIESTESQYDDRFALPVITALRVAFAIDDDEENFVEPE